MFFLSIIVILGQAQEPDHKYHQFEEPNAKHEEFANDH